MGLETGLDIFGGVELMFVCVEIGISGIGVRG